MQSEVDPLSGRPRLVIKRMLSKQPMSNRYKLPQPEAATYSPKHITEKKGRFRNNTPGQSYELTKKGGLADNRYSNHSSGVAQSIDFKKNSRIGSGLVNKSSMQPPDTALHNSHSLSQISVPGTRQLSNNRLKKPSSRTIIRDNQ